MRFNIIKLFMLCSVVLPQVSESVFGPCLLMVSEAFNISVAQAEQVYTYYLIGYALGMLIWGWFSDLYGVIYTYRLGIISYLIGCALCVSTSSILVLMLSRLLQGIGASVCTVLAYVLCRTLFEGYERIKMQANISIALSIGPFMGPVIGGLFLSYGIWQMVFLPLAIYAAGLLLFSSMCSVDSPKQEFSCRIIKSRAFDLELWLRAILIGCACGVGFNFFAEGPYVFMQGLGMSKQAFSRSFMLIGASWYSGGLYAKYLASRMSVPHIISRGIKFGMVFAIAIAYVLYFYAEHPYVLPVIWCLVILMMASNSLVIGNSIASTLSKYDTHIGMMTSFLGFLYYCVMAVTTYLMSICHDGSLIALPAFWFKLFLIVGTIQLYLTTTNARSH
jgi:polar amino acid transport system substrate-binding protein